MYKPGMLVYFIKNNGFNVAEGVIQSSTLFENGDTIYSLREDLGGKSLGNFKEEDIITSKTRAIVIAKQHIRDEFRSRMNSITGE